MVLRGQGDTRQTADCVGAAASALGADAHLRIWPSWFTLLPWGDFTHAAQSISPTGGWSRLHQLEAAEP
jgi:hypothetical protein